MDRSDSVLPQPITLNSNGIDGHSSQLWLGSFRGVRGARGVRGGRVRGQGGNFPVNKCRLRPRSKLLWLSFYKAEKKTPPLMNVLPPLAKDLREIRQLQKGIDNLILKRPFHRVIREIMANQRIPDLRIQASALRALHESAEAWLIAYFESKLCSVLS
jgi:histone H3/H4